MDRSIGDPGHEKDVIDFLKARDKIYLRGRLNILSKRITTNCEGLYMLHSASNTSAVSFEEQRKYILKEASGIACKVARFKMRKDKKIKIIRKAAIL